MARPDLDLGEERGLVDRASRGDRKAFETLYRAHAPVLFSYVLVPMLGDRDDAQDCLRETFMSAQKALPRFEWKPSGIYPWLKTLAKNKARDLLRASGRRQRLRGAFAEHLGTGADGASSAAEERVAQRQLRDRIETVLETLKPRHAAVLRLRLLEDKTRDECAAELRIAKNAVDQLLFRASASFRRACTKHGIPLE